MEKQINEKYAQIHAHRRTLIETDYHVIKEAEGVYVTPVEIHASRQFAREEINRLEAEIEKLQADLEKVISTNDEIEL